MALARQIAVDRPYVITYLLLALTLAMLERRRGLWLLPPIFVFWANVHGGFFMGWVLLGAYCGEALIQRLRKQPPGDERTHSPPAQHSTGIACRAAGRICHT